MQPLKKTIITKPMNRSGLLIILVKLKWITLKIVYPIEKTIASHNGINKIRTTHTLPMIQSVPNITFPISILIHHPYTNSSDASLLENIGFQLHVKHVVSDSVPIYDLPHISQDFRCLTSLISGNLVLLLRFFTFITSFLFLFLDLNNFDQVDLSKIPRLPSNQFQIRQ